MGASQQRYLWQLIYFCFYSQLCFGLSSCSPARVAPAETSSVQGVSEELTESFTVTKSGQLDVAMVIDGADYMVDKATNVQAQLPHFFEEMESLTDFRFAVIVKKGRLNLPSSYDLPRYKHIDIYAEATSVAAVAASASCPTELTDSTVPGRICGVEFESTAKIPDHEPNARNGIFSARSSLLDFLRPTAQLAYVFVTINNPKVVNSSNLLSLVEEHVGSQNPKVYAFRGAITTTGATPLPCRAVTKGEHYESLATATGGRLFDVCTENWSSEFANLTSALSDAANPPFALKHAPKNILSVTLNGATVPANQYTIIGQGLRLAPTVLRSVGSDLSVKYSY